MPAGSHHPPETPLERWHRVMQGRGPQGLEPLVADHCVFHSRVVRAPRKGRMLTRMYLPAAMQVLAAGDFRYVRKIVGETDALLEFVVDIDGITVNGFDLVHWNAAGPSDT
jgi:hypothetical protein